MTDRATQFHELYREQRIAEQGRFYRDRAAEYRAAHRQAIFLRNLLLVVSAFAGALGQLTEGTVRAGLAVLAAVLATLAASVTGFESLIGFPRLSKLYTDAARNLARADVDWVAAGPQLDPTERIDQIEEILRKEVGQWGQLLVEAKGTGTRGSAAPTDGDAERKY
jgi:hypothetical protein